MVEFDNILKHFGKRAYAHQILFTLLISWNALPFGMHTLAPVMYAAKSNFRCNDDTGEQNKTTGTYYYNNQCVRKVFNGTNCNATSSQSCLNYSVTIPCDSGFIFDRSRFSNTIVMEWDLVCSKSILPSVATSAYMAGMWLGSIIFGYISDRFGRRPSLLVSVIGSVITSFSLSLSLNIWMFISIRFLVGLLCYPAFMISFIYALEINYKKRTLAGLLIHIPFAVGHALNSVVAYFCRNWRIFNIVISAFFLPYLVIHFFIPESPRWYFSHDRVEEGKRSSFKFVKKQEISDKECENLWSNSKSPNSQNQKIRHNFSSLDLFRFSKMRIVTIKVILIWFSTSLIFYGLSLNVGALNGDIFVNNAMNAGVEIIISMIIISTLDRIGRRYLLSGTLVFSAMSCFVNAVLNSTMQQGIARTIISLCGKIGAAGAFQILYNFTAELYPTVVRGNGVGVGSMAARIGSICTPFVVRLYHVSSFLPEVIFGCVAFCAGALVLTLPETTNSTLPQTAEEAELMYQNPKRHVQRNHDDDVIQL